MSAQLLKQLDDLGIADNTIVLYTTDNGAEIALWPDGAMTPFRGEKGTTWEGGFRIPMMVRWPGVIKPGTQVQRHHLADRLVPDLLPRPPASRTSRSKMKPGYQAGRQDLQGPSRRLQLPAVLQGRGEEAGRATPSITSTRAAI